MSDYRYLAPPQADDELGRLGHYRVLRVLGEGGMGLVFAAEDLHLHRPVALKVLRPELLDDTSRKRFFNEARIAASLPHDHIVTVFQVGQEGQMPFLAMELLHGESLETRLEREHSLPVAEVLRIAREALEGLAEAHERGLIHRDVKPGNIWLESDGPGGHFRRVKLLDFGIARPIENYQNLTADGQLLATPDFMAPEIATGVPLDGRSDLFSLGSVIYRALSGASPFASAGRSTMQMVAAVVHQEPTPLRERLPSLPVGVADLVRALMEKEPDARPANAQAAIDRIRRLERGEIDPTVNVIALAGVPTPRHKPKLGPAFWASVGVLFFSVALGGAWQLSKYLNPPQPANTTKSN